MTRQICSGYRLTHAHQVQQNAPIDVSGGFAIGDLEAIQIYRSHDTPIWRDLVCGPNHIDGLGKCQRNYPGGGNRGKGEKGKRGMGEWGNRGMGKRQRIAATMKAIGRATHTASRLPIPLFPVSPLPLFPSSPFFLFSSHAKSIRHAIDVVKPGSNQRDLENPLVVKPDCPQLIVILAADSRCIARDLGHVVQHYPFLLRDGSSLVVSL